MWDLRGHSSCRLLWSARHGTCCHGASPQGQEGEGAWGLHCGLGSSDRRLLEAGMGGGAGVRLLSRVDK